MTIQTRLYESPAGELILGSIGSELCLCDWTHGHKHAANLQRLRRILKAQTVSADSSITALAISQLNEYFCGQRRSFTIPLRFAGSDFQCRVWQELLSIPFGKVTTYGNLARRIGNPKAVRAVAAAIATNPLSVLVPCHRVVGVNGVLTGYAGGLPAKQMLLNLEFRS